MRGLGREVAAQGLTELLDEVALFGGELLGYDDVNRDDLVAPIAAGQAIGTVKVSLDGQVVAQAPLVAVNPVEEAGFFKRLWDAFWMWWESE